MRIFAVNIYPKSLFVFYSVFLMEGGGGEKYSIVSELLQRWLCEL